MKVAIIGAGLSGLAGARRCQEYGFQCDVFELKEEVGGVWAYNKKTGLDRYGYPLNYVMYRGLRVNTPKETMEFPGFRMREHKVSYITHYEVSEYLNSFADHFNLRHLIKLNTIVTDVRPLEENSWQVTYVDKPTKKQFTHTYDAVMVCNGHYSTPYMPKVDGIYRYKGSILHSSSYRFPDPYIGKKVLTVGAGISGIDITLHLMDAGVQAILSHHRGDARLALPTTIHQKPDIRYIDENGTVIFVDDTSDTFDAIIFCTGYLTDFPFLHESCGIKVEQDYVQPLYKHLINIERPTMAIVGLPSIVIAFPLFDLQVRYFCQLLNGSFSLPSKDDMRDNVERDLQNRSVKDFLGKKGHQLNDPYENEYILDIATEAGVTPVPIVINKLKQECLKYLFGDYMDLREHNYRIIDDETFEEIL